MKNPKVSCTDCYDKGYHTVATGGSMALGDFIGDKPFNAPFEIVKKPCKCQKREKATLSNCCKAPIALPAFSKKSKKPMGICTGCDKIVYLTELEDNKPVSDGYCRVVCGQCDGKGYYYDYQNSLTIKVNCGQCDEGRKLAGTYKEPVVTSTHQSHVEDDKPVSCGKECEQCPQGREEGYCAKCQTVTFNNVTIRGKIQGKECDKVGYENATDEEKKEILLKAAKEGWKEQEKLVEACDSVRRKAIEECIALITAMGRGGPYIEKLESLKNKKL